MRTLAMVVAGIAALVGITGMAAPQFLFLLATYGVTPAGLYVAAVLRVCIGLLLLGVARVSRAPKALRVFGVLLVMAGVATALLGVRRANDLLVWWFGLGSPVHRLSGAVALVAGVLLFYAVAPEEAKQA